MQKNMAGGKSMNNDLGSKAKEIQELISLLNKARDDYYNNSGRVKS